MAVLVTGLGYMGAALAARLARQGEEVVGLENGFSTDARALDELESSGLRIVKGDVADAAIVESAFRAARIETVYHFAAQASGHPEAATAEYTERTNLRGPRIVLEAMRRHHTPTFVFASSLKVYGDNPAGVLSEDRPYGAFRDLSHLSKVYVEKLMQLYAEVHGLRCLPLRYGVVYGPGPVFKTDERFMTVPNKFCRQVVRGEALTVHGGGDVQVGFVHLDDAVRATLALAGEESLTGYVPVNVNAEVVSLATLAALVTAEGDRFGLATFPVANVATRPVPARFSVPSRLDGLLFQYERTLRDGIREALRYFMREKSTAPA